MNLDYADTMLVRSLTQVFILSLVIMYKGLSIFPNHGEENMIKIRILTIVQGFWGAIMITCGFCCVLFMPLGDAMTVLFTTPLSTMIMAAIFLKHRLRLFKITCCLMLLSGAVLVIRPTFLFPDPDPDLDFVSQTLNTSLKGFQSLIALEDHYQEQHDYHNYYYYIGALIAFVSALSDGCLNVAINYCHQVKPAVLLWWAGIGGIIVSLVSNTFDHNAKILGPHITEVTWMEWMSLLGITMSGLIGYFCMTKSLQMIDPTTVAFIRALEIIFGYAFQIIIMHQLPTLLSIAGASLVLISILAITLQNYLLSIIPNKIKFLF